VLLRLDDEQVTTYWENIRQTLLANDLPMADANANSMKVVLHGLLQGSIQAWILYNIVEGKEDILAMALTAFSVEPVTLTKNLVIYNLYGYSFVPPRMWTEGLQGFKKFAKANDCYTVIAYSKVPRIMQIAQELGGDTSMHVINLEIE